MCRHVLLTCRRFLVWAGLFCWTHHNISCGPTRAVGPTPTSLVCARHVLSDPNRLLLCVPGMCCWTHPDFSRVCPTCAVGLTPTSPACAWHVLSDSPRLFSCVPDMWLSDSAPTSGRLFSYSISSILSRGNDSFRFIYYVIARSNLTRHHCMLLDGGRLDITVCSLTEEDLTSLYAPWWRETYITVCYLMERELTSLYAPWWRERLDITVYSLMEGDLTSLYTPW